jgi:hypothetical protein
MHFDSLTSLLSKLSLPSVSNPLCINLAGINSAVTEVNHR